MLAESQLVVHWGNGVVYGKLITDTLKIYCNISENQLGHIIIVTIYLYVFVFFIVTGYIHSLFLVAKTPDIFIYSKSPWPRDTRNYQLSTKCY